MALKILKDRQLISKVLIIAPLQVIYHVWPDEIRKWAEFNDLRYTMLHGGKKEQALQEDSDIYLINPEGLSWLFGKKIIPQFDVLIIDESTKFKNTTTVRFKALKRFLPLFTRRWILTGTPAPNGLMDLFGQVYILDLGSSLGRFITHYRQQYFVPSGYGGYEWKPKPDALEQICEAISPLVLRMSAEEYLQMPELIKLEKKVKLPPDVRKVYDQLEDEFITTWDEETFIGLNAAAVGTKLRQMANGSVYTDGENYKVFHDEKLDALEALLEELNGHPTLVLYEYNHDRERLLGRFRDVGCVSTTPKARVGRLLADFNSGRIPVLLGHPGSMGVGLNLQGSCHHVIWFGIPWDLMHYDQTIARVYRQGQSSEKVFVYHIVAEGTRDERVSKVLSQKDRTQKDIFNAITTHRKSLAE